MFATDTEQPAPSFDPSTQGAHRRLCYSLAQMSAMRLVGGVCLSLISFSRLLSPFLRRQSYTGQFLYSTLNSFGVGEDSVQVKEVVLSMAMHKTE